eukprot:TRINITY_DN22972_c0_g1_i1.p1 TRINITY_DN22972_c0_g1~~TRINITY_DN22972_c0_g1_i1.p1  ORF type:complete len:487 (+),score=177.40 TRINITY_DN22972_c0_g1_i1:144-1604(+)
MFRRMSSHLPAHEKGRGGSAEDEHQKRDDQNMYGRIRATMNRLLRSPQYAPPCGAADVVCATWNVAEEAPSGHSFAEWLRVDLGQRASRRPHFIVVTLQEVDMSVSALVAEYSEKGDAWCEAIHRQIGGQRHYVAVSPTQVVGLMLMVFVRADIAGQVRHVATDIVRLGKGGRLGNKGAVGLSLRYRGRAMCFIAAHLAQNAEGWQKRNDSYHQVIKDMAFEVGHTADAYFSLRREACLEEDRQADGGEKHVKKKKLGVLDDHDYVVFCGDLNYRLHDQKEEEARALIAGGAYAQLLKHDQLLLSIAQEEAFTGFVEADIAFPPTYKLHRHDNAYEESWEDRKGKVRVPAWTDRVVVWTAAAPDNRAVVRGYNSYDLRLSDHRPVSARIELDVWQMPRREAAAHFDTVAHVAEGMEKRAWTRRWFTRYLTPAYESLVDNAHGVSPAFHMSSSCDSPSATVYSLGSEAPSTPNGTPHSSQRRGLIGV